jgi:hypothetical protein
LSRKLKHSVTILHLRQEFSDQKNRTVRPDALAETIMFMEPETVPGRDYYERRPNLGLEKILGKVSFCQLHAGPTL